MEPKQRIQELTELLNDANTKYYVLDAPEMADYEYDRLLRELEELEAAYPELALPDSPSRRVGGEALSQFEKVTHAVPLMSLQDVFSTEELRYTRATPALYFLWSPRSTACLWRWNMKTAPSSGVQPVATAMWARMSRLT